MAGNGFNRAEMNTEKLSGSVDPYGRHVFLCHKTYNDWPITFESSNSDGVARNFSRAFIHHKNAFPVRTLFTVCEVGDGTGFSSGDVLIFPEMIKYGGIEEWDVNRFVEDVLVNDQPWDLAPKETVAGSYVFICAHKNRDARCGVCGPPLIEKFNKEIGMKGLKGQVFVSACSHIGGHKYAGNLIIYSAVQDDKVSGHWYGYVTPNDVTQLLDQHIRKGEIIERIWRGQMGVPPDKEATKAVKKTQRIKEAKENIGVLSYKGETSEAKTKGPELVISMKTVDNSRFMAAATGALGLAVIAAFTYIRYKRS